MFDPAPMPEGHPVGVMLRQHPLAQAILADFPRASLVCGDTSGKYGPDTDLTLLYATDAAQYGVNSFSDEAKLQAVNSWDRSWFGFWVQVPGLPDRWAARIAEED